MLCAERAENIFVCKCHVQTTTFSAGAFAERYTYRNLAETVARRRRRRRRQRWRRISENRKRANGNRVLVVLFAFGEDKMRLNVYK